jgi:hypothetical protein
MDPADQPGIRFSQGGVCGSRVKAVTVPRKTSAHSTPSNSRLYLTSLHITSFLCLFLVFNGQIYSGPYRPDLVGQFVLPNVQGVESRADCNDFSRACVAEASGDYETAISLYEDKYVACGDHGWNITGHADGSNDFVVFKRTPCGLHVAIKPARTGKECRILRNLTSTEVYAECPGCFPRYYHLSNLTKACYSQYVQPTRLPGFHPSNRNVEHVKTLYLQLVHIIRVLRAHNLEHRDMSFRNLMATAVGTSPTGVQQVRLVMFDFGAAKPLDSLGYLDRTQEKLRLKRNHEEHAVVGTPTPRRLDGNGLHTDIYAASCTFMDKLYNEPQGLPRAETCWRDILPVTTDPNSMRHALVQIMMDNDNHTVHPQYHRIRALVDAVSRF